MSKAAVTAIRWVPGSDGRILASYTDGCMLLLDTEREDAPLSLEVNTTDMYGAAAALVLGCGCGVLTVRF